MVLLENLKIHKFLRHIHVYYNDPLGICGLCVVWLYNPPLLKIIFSDFETIFNEHDTLNEIMRVRWYGHRQHDIFKR